MPWIIVIPLQFSLCCSDTNCQKSKLPSGPTEMVPNIGSLDVLGRQFPEAFAAGCAGPGFLGVAVQEYLGDPRLSTTALEPFICGHMIR